VKRRTFLGALLAAAAPLPVVAAALPAVAAPAATAAAPAWMGMDFGADDDTTAYVCFVHPDLESEMRELFPNGRPMWNGMPWPITAREIYAWK
jgi:hypothetical protein